MATTDIHGWPLPDGTDNPVVHVDMKNLADAMDGQVPFVCTSTTRPPNVPGLVIFETDTKRTRQGDGSRWMILHQPWTKFTPTVSQWGSTLGSNPKLEGWYCVIADNYVHSYMKITCGAGATQSPNFPYVTIGLPFPMKADIPSGDFAAQAYGDGGHLIDGIGGGLRRLFISTASGGGECQIFAFPTGGQVMGSMANSGYPANKAGTMMMFEIKYRAEIPQ